MKIACALQGHPLLGQRATTAAALAPFTTYKVGGVADVLVRVGRRQELEALMEVLGAVEEAPPVLVIGRGSNLLVSDRGWPGVAVLLDGEFEAFEIAGTTVRAGAAVRLPVLARASARAGLTGFEWAVGVPGSVGGAVRMNAGGHGSDMAASVVSVELAQLVATDDGPAGRRTVAAAGLELGYRTSAVTADELVVGAELELEPGDSVVSEQMIDEIVRWRRANQPGGQNAGSVFANPDGDSAGRLIDAAGLKGHRVGTAQVSDKHANFIQADAGGAAEDVYRLISHIQSVVAERFAVELQPENKLVGEFGQPEPSQPEFGEPV